MLGAECLPSSSFDDRYPHAHDAEFEQRVCVALHESDTAMRSEEIGAALQNSDDRQRDDAVVLMERLASIEELRKVHFDAKLPAGVEAIFRLDGELAGVGRIRSVAGDAIELVDHRAIGEGTDDLLIEEYADPFHVQGAGERLPCLAAGIDLPIRLEGSEERALKDLDSAGESGAF